MTNLCIFLARQNCCHQRSWNFLYNIIRKNVRKFALEVAIGQEAMINLTGVNWKLRQKTFKLSPSCHTLSNALTMSRNMRYKRNFDSKLRVLSHVACCCAENPLRNSNFKIIVILRSTVARSLTQVIIGYSHRDLDLSVIWEV